MLNLRQFLPGEPFIQADVGDIRRRQKHHKLAYHEVYNQDPRNNRDQTPQVSALRQVLRNFLKQIKFPELLHCYNFNQIIDFGGN